MAKADRKTLIKSNDLLWAQCIKTRDRKCLYSNKDYDLQAHHVCQRTHLRTRWWLENGITLTKGVHFFEKVDFEKFRNIVISVVGQHEYQMMQEAGRGDGKPFKMSIEDLRQMNDSLKAQLRSLQSDYGKLI